jgi:cytochrome c oxidase cbb3-type subunit 3
MAEGNNPFPGENNTGHIWDDDLRELSNPPPRWWTLAFYASIGFVVLYSILYPMWPGLTGYTKGIMGWSMMDEYNEDLKAIEAVRAPYEDRIAKMSAAEILADSELVAYVERAGKVLFGDNCAACHGSGGQGNVGFPVLADDDWLWGGTIDKIQETITMGRKGVMTAHAKILSADEVDTLANWVVGMSEGKQDEAAKQLFAQKGCIACHGPDAKGMQMLGSANLTDGIFRFRPAPGSTQLDSVKQTILHGVNDASDPETREAVMPSFKDRLSADKIKKLAVYVHRLGGGQ